jgi:hypothetical protein
VVHVDLEVKPVFAEQIDAATKPSESVRARGSASNSTMRRMPRTMGWRSAIAARIGSAPAPFLQRRHGHDGPEPQVAPRLFLDELDLLKILAALSVEVGVAFQKHHRLDIDRTDIAGIVLDVVWPVEERVSLDPGIPQPRRIPDVQVRVNDRKVRHHVLR